MKNTKINTDDLLLLLNRQNEVTRRVAAGELTIESAIAGTQGILDEKYPTKDRFKQFTYFLRPLYKQAIELKRLNSKMDESMRVPDIWFDRINTSSYHVQSIEDLEFYFIVPGTLKETYEYQIELIRLTQPSITCSDSSMNVSDICLDSNADIKMYAKPGIYRRRINLIDNWDLITGRTIDQVRKKALDTGKKLAGLPAIGAYAAQDPDLYKLQDGQNLPYFDIADVQQGQDFACTPYTYHHCNDNVIYFDSCNSKELNKTSAAPTFVWEY